MADTTSFLDNKLCNIPLKNIRQVVMERCGKRKDGLLLHCTLYENATFLSLLSTAVAVSRESLQRGVCLGGVCPGRCLPGGVYLEGCLPWGVSELKGVWIEGVCLRGVCHEGCLPSGVSALKGVCLEGCLPWGVFALRGVCLEGCLPWGESAKGSLPRGVSVQGVSAWEDVFLEGCQTDTHRDRMTDRCKIQWQNVTSQWG